ncbi:MAG: cell division protein FtsX, partial [Bacteroidia bacterium]|nr:cell division protein FtsX [Bacteroidia bacterium]
RTLRTSSISTIVSIAMVLFLLGLFGAILLLANKVTRHVKENITLTVFLDDKIEKQDAQYLIDTLSARAEVRELKFISKDDAAAQMKEDLGEDFVEFIGYNPLQSSIDIKLNADYVDDGRIQFLLGRIENEKIVDEVKYEESLVEKINKNLRVVGILVMIVCGILLLITLGLINNTIRLALYAKRLLIRSMQLVGATRSFIRTPFVWKGVKHGIYGAAIACAMLSLLLYAGQRQVPDILSFEQMEHWLILIGAIFGLGIVISMISTYFAVNKFLGQDADELF